MIPLQAQDGREDGRAKCMTRLVLPIRYCFSGKEPGTDEENGQPESNPFDYNEWVYKRTPPEAIEDIWRRSAYFTVDTSYALFRRTHWYRLEPVTKRSDPAKELIWTCFIYSAPQFTADEQRVGETRNITVEVAPPTVVLFDAESARNWHQSDPLFQIGFLYLDFYLSCTSSKEPAGVRLEDLLEFNERARCLWLPWKGYGKGYLAVMKRCRHQWPVGQVAEETKSYLGMWSAALSYPVALDGQRERKWLTTKEMRENAASWANCCGEAACDAPCFPREASAIPITAKDTEGHTGWLATTDYRAFVWSFAYTKSGNDSLSGRFGGPTDRPERYGHWVKFMNVDSPSEYWSNSKDAEAKNNETSAFERDWARERTYARWAHCGTYYGISPHCGSMLTAYPDSSPPYDRHFRTLYFDQVLLLLYLRVFAFQLSIRMAKLSARVGDALAKSKSPHTRNHVLESHRNGIQKVRQLFMSFSSLYQFPLLSTQQQGVELYTLYRKHMDIDDLYGDVSNEIDTWDRVIAQHVEETVSRRVSIITFLGLPVAMVTMVLAGLASLLGLPFGWIARPPRIPTAGDRLGGWFDGLNRHFGWLPTVCVVLFWGIVIGILAAALCFSFNRWINWIETRRETRGE